MQRLKSWLGPLCLLALLLGVPIGLSLPTTGLYVAAALIIVPLLAFAVSLAVDRVWPPSRTAVFLMPDEGLGQRRMVAGVRARPWQHRKWYMRYEHGQSWYPTTVREADLIRAERIDDPPQRLPLAG